MDTTAVLEVLRDSPFGAGLPRSSRRCLVGLGRLRVARTGDTLLGEGGPTSELGIVRSGRLALRLAVPGRGPTTVLTVEPGDLFGWSALVPPYRSTSTVVAVEPAQVVVFDAAALRAALAEDPELAAAIYPRVLRAVARRLEGTRLQLLDLFHLDRDRAW